LVRISPDEISRRGRVPKNGSVFFTIFQTFMSGPGGAPYFGEYPADFFDFIVVDECHRGGANDDLINQTKTSTDPLYCVRVPWFAKTAKADVLDQQRAVRGDHGQGIVQALMAVQQTLHHPSCLVR
jgi:hypothetical protein